MDGIAYLEFAKEVAEGKHDADLDGIIGICKDRLATLTRARLAEAEGRQGRLDG